MVEKAVVCGWIEAILHILGVIFGIGGFAASIAVLFTLGRIDMFDNDVPDDSDEGEDRRRFRVVGGWVMSVNFAGIILQLLLAINFGCVYFKITKASFKTFGITCYVCIMLLAIGLIAGAAGISANARDVQLDYIDSDYTTDCETINDLTVNYLFANATAIDEAQEQCDFILRLRNSQATAAIMSYLGMLTCLILSISIMVNFIAARNRYTAA